MAGESACQMLTVQWGLLVSMATGVLGSDTSVIGLAASGSISVLLLVAIIFFIALSFSWTDWFNTFMGNKGKVLMSRAYWKSKEDAKKRLDSAIASSVVNGQPPAQSLDTASWVQGWSQRANQHGNKIYEEKDVTMDLGEEANDEFTIETVLRDNEVLDVGPFKTVDSNEQPIQASWVQGWSQRANQHGNKIYEEKDVTMDLGEEANDEFTIETVLRDNEVLDVGPFKTVHSNEQPIQGDIYPEPYIYATVEKASFRRCNDANGSTPSTEPSAIITTMATTTSTNWEGMGSSGETQEVTSEENGYAQVTNYEDMLVHL